MIQRGHTSIKIELALEDWNNWYMTSSYRPIVIGVALAGILALLFITSILLLQRTGVENPFAQLDLKIFGFIVAYTLVSYLVISKLGIETVGRQKIRNLHWFGRSLGSDISIGIAGAILGSCCIFTSGWIFGAWSPTTFLEQESSFSFNQRVLFLLIGMNAGLIEETLFRGYLQPAFIAKTSTIVGIALTSLIFALYHLNFHPLGFAGKLILGFVFGVIRGRENPLLRSSIAHAGTWLFIGAV